MKSSLGGQSLTLSVLNPSALTRSTIPEIAEELFNLQVANAQFLNRGASPAVMQMLPGTKDALERAKALKSHSYLSTLSELFEGNPNLYSLTESGTLSTSFGGRRIHIPTFDAFARDVSLAGVRYAPLQHARWDPVRKRTVLISAADSLDEALKGLLQKGIKRWSQPEQAREISRTLSKWRSESLRQMRFGRIAAGGAESFFLSSSVSISDAAHPAIKLLRQSEEHLGAAISSALQGGRPAIAKAGELFQVTPSAAAEKLTADTPKYLLDVRKSVTKKLAANLILLEEGGYISQSGKVVDGIKSPGSKGGFSLRGIGASDYEAGRMMGDTSQEARIVASRLGTHEYSLLDPRALERKGIHHTRMAMALQTGEVRSIYSRNKMGRVAPMFYTDAERTADQVAAMSMKRQGAMMRSSGVLRKFALTGGLIRARAGASAEDTAAVNKLLGKLFGDSQVIPAQEGMLRLSAEANKRTTLKILHPSTYHSQYAQMEMTPAVLDLIRKQGAGQVVMPDAGLSFDEVVAGFRGSEFEKHFGEQAIRRDRGGRITGILLGRSVTTTGTAVEGKGGEHWLFKGQRITGIRTSKNLTHIEVTRRASQSVRETAPFLIGEGQRVSMGRAMLYKGADVHYLAAAGKSGQDLTSVGGFMENLVRRIEMETDPASAKAALDEIAAITKGRVSRLYGSTAITDISEPLFPMIGTEMDRVQDVTKLKQAIDIAEKYGVKVGPEDDAARRNLLSQAFVEREPGRFVLNEKVGEGTGRNILAQLTRGQGLQRSQIEALAERLGPEYADEVRRLAGQMEMVKQYTTGSIRAGQPIAGKFGSVAVRMRDLRYYAVEMMAMGGASVKDMIEKDGVLDPAKFKGATAEQISDFRGYLKMWQRQVRPKRGIGNYMEAMQATQQGDEFAEALRGKKGYRFISAEQYAKDYGKLADLTSKGKLRPGATIEDLRGTAFVTEVDGKLKWSTDTVLVKMTEEGYVQQRRGEMLGVKTSYAVLPSGQAAFGTKVDEQIQLSAKKRLGLTLSFGEQSLALHNRLVSNSGDPRYVYRAQSAAYVTAAEDFFGKKGAYMAGRGKLATSLRGTMVEHSGLGAGEIGLTKRGVERFLARQGFRGDELAQKVERIAQGTEDYFIHMKTEPMRSQAHVTVNKIRVIGDEIIRSSPADRARRIREAGEYAVYVNPADLPIRQRDFDFDPAYLFNLAKRAGKKGPGALANVQMEQRALEFIFNQRSDEYKAIRSVGEMINADKMTKGSKIGALTNSLLQDAKAAAEEAIGRKIATSAAGVETAMAAVMADVPGMLTPMANVRWRTQMNIMQNYALGLDVESLLTKGATGAMKADIQDALAFLGQRTKGMKYLHTLAETSEYAFLKKAGSEKVLMSLADFISQPDSVFSALAGNIKMGEYKPGTEGAAKAVERIEGALGTLFEEAEGQLIKRDGTGVLDVLYKDGGGRAKVIREMAEAFQTVSYISEQGFKPIFDQMQTTIKAGGSAIQTNQGIAKLYGLLMSGRDPDFAGRIMHDASGYMSGVAGIVTQGGRDAADGAAGNPVKGLGAWALQWAEKAKQFIKTPMGKISLAATAGLFIANSLSNVHRGAEGDVGPGAPMPPPPMVDGIGPDRMLGYNMMPDESARIQRVPQVRIHAQFSGDGGAGVDFTSIANNNLTMRGLAPAHHGSFLTDPMNAMQRAKIEAQAHSRLNSEF